MNLIIKIVALVALSTSLLAQNNIILDEDFNDNAIDPALVFRPDLEGFDGRVDVVANEGVSGSPGLMIGKYEDSGLTRNGLDIHLAIADSTDVYVQFEIRDFFDENNFQDGLFLSNNGGTSFQKVYSFKPEDWCNNIWGKLPAFKLDDLAAEIGMSFTNNFVVRIQQYDNADFNGSGDEDGFVIDELMVFTRHPLYAGLPFDDDFDDGFFDNNWNWSHPDKSMLPLVCTAKPTGLVEIRANAGSDSSPAMAFGKICDDGLTANAMDLHLNLGGLSDVYFSFSMLDFFEENHNQDGLFFSNDGGATFHQVYTFKAEDWCNNTWGAFPPFHVNALAASVGLDLTSTFIIRIQQYDNADFNGSGDEDGFIIDNVLVEQRAPVYATLPFQDDFNDGVLDPSWAWSHADATMAPVECTVKPTGLVQITDASGTNGTPGVVMGKICDDGLTSNALDLHLNLGGLSDVYFSFWIRDFFEENHGQDGLFFSNDGGATFHQVYTFKAEDWCSNTWGAFPPFHVDALAASAGLDLTSTFIIRIQQYDNADFNGSGDEDGLVIDDVLVEQRAPVYATLPFEDNFDNSNNGALGASWSWSHADATMTPVECTAKPTGFVGIVDASGTNGTPGVEMGKLCDDGLTSNALDLHLNLGGLSDVYFSFWVREFFEENHNQDGLFFSNDGGTTFHQVYTFKGEDWCSDVWGAFPPFHVDALAASVGLDLTSTFIIRIQQYDDADFNGSGDEDGLVIDDVLVEQRAPVYATLPFLDNFDNAINGALGPSWTWSHPDATMAPVECTAKPTGFVGITDASGTNGTPGVVIGKRCDDGLTANALDLHLDLGGLSDVYFSFSIREFFEENHNQDGLFFSNDGGASFHQVYTFKGTDWCNDVWGAFPPFHVDALAASVGLDLTSTFIIRIQQYDDADFNGSGDEDGLVIDDVLVEQRTPVYASLPFLDNFDNSNDGALGESWNWVHGDSTMLPLECTVKPTGFVYITDASGVSGTPGLQIGKRCDDGLTSNALDLHLNLQNAENIVLCFDLLDFFNENHTQDGLYFSNDGGQNFTQIVLFDFVTYPDNQFSGIPVSVNLDSLSNVFNLDYSNQCILRFQQFDDADFNGSGDEDGFILDNISVKADVVNAVDDLSKPQNYCSLFPNPTNGILTIQSNTEIERIKIMDTKGQILLIKEDFLNINAKVDLTTFSDGIYFIVIASEEGVEVKSFVKH